MNSTIFKSNFEVISNMISINTIKHLDYFIKIAKFFFLK